MSTVCSKYVPWAKQAEIPESICKKKIEKSDLNEEAQGLLRKHKEWLQRSSVMISSAENADERERLKTLYQSDFGSPEDRIISFISNNTGCDEEEAIHILDKWDVEEKQKVKTMAKDLREVHYELGRDSIELQSTQRESFPGYSTSSKKSFPSST